MNNDAILARYAQEFGGWKVDQLLGRGGFGEVVRIRRERFGVKEFSAMKVVHLLEGRKQFGRIPSDYYQIKNQLRDTDLKEVVLMQQLAGNTHIVDFQDWDVKDWEDGDHFGCDLVIRMELLQSLDSILEKQSTLPEREVAAIGVDICRALELCHGKGIIHRDIKPGNIFRNKEGAYKIGDFGISRIAEGGRASTQAGTPVYAAPEQLGGGGHGKYGKTVDIYSLGITLYQLLNGNRLPFVESTYFSNRTIAEANMKRCSGVPLPPLKGCSSRLASVILKACAFKPENRYQTAREFREELEGAFDPMARHSSVGTGRQPVQPQPVKKPQPVQPDPKKGVNVEPKVRQNSGTPTQAGQALQEAKEEWMEMLAQQTGWSDKYHNYQTGDARRIYDEAERAAGRKDYVTAINKIHECGRVLRKDSDYSHPAYMCWKLMEYYLGDHTGEGSGKSMARHYYELAVKRNPALKDAAVEKRIQEKEGSANQELDQIAGIVRNIPLERRRAWERELQSIFDQSERANPFSPEDRKIYETLEKELEASKINMSSMVTRLGPLSRKYARASYLMAKVYEKGGSDGDLSYWGCGRLLKKYPAGLCLAGVECAIRHRKVENAKNWFHRLRAAAPEIR